MQRYVIIVAGGSGQRMNAEIPKQFLLLKDKPVLMHTVEAFSKPSINAQIIIVLNVDYLTQWERLVKQYGFDIPHVLIRGGATRFHSVKNGLKEIPKNALVAVHDAVRPLIDEDIINKSFQLAEHSNTAVVAVKSKESLRKKISDTTTEAVDRENYYLVQTPQVFKSDLLHKAYQQEFRNEFTDDASVVERLGEQINLVEGNYKNIKITFPEDLLIAESLLGSY
jgi:2-C-methyl-D-erythritol 4-phosphate cytidylyltransferase